MTSPVTLFHCTLPCCRGQASVTAPSVRSTDPAPIVHYDSLIAILDSVCMLPSVKDLLSAIEAPRRRTGRKGYSPLSMFRAWLTKFLIGRENTQAFIRELKRPEGLRGVCGLVNGVPHKSTFSRFFSRLSENTDALESAQAELVKAMVKYLPDLGLHLAIDATDVPSYSSSRRQRKKVPVEQRTDPDATWGYRTPKSKHGGGTGKRGKSENKDKNGDGHFDLFCGFKAHTIADVTTGLPLGYIVHPANVSESRELPKVLDKVLDRHSDWLKPDYLMGDKVFDGEPSHDAIMKRGITPIIDIKRPASTTGGGTKHPNRHKGGLYAPDGSPTCPDAVHTSMEYIGTVRESDGSIFHEYRCNPNGCPLKSRSSGAMLYCDTREIHREKVEEGNYRMQGPVARANPLWKELYDQRLEIERLFSRLKESRSLESLTYRGLPKVRAHVGLSVLSYLGTALGRVREGRIDLIRTMTMEDEF